MTISKSLAFQSTPLMRGETIASTAYCGIDPYFNPLPSCEGRHVMPKYKQLYEIISIHSPHARGDSRAPPLLGAACGFQSTPLMRGETLHVSLSRRDKGISIHSPHARGDDKVFSFLITPQHFNPLPSCEGRRNRELQGLAPVISIHSPHARGDEYSQLTSVIHRHFNPLPSCEGRLFSSHRISIKLDFNPLPSCEGRHLEFVEE